MENKKGSKRKCISYLYDGDGALRIPNGVRKERKNEPMNFKVPPPRKLLPCIRCRRFQFFRKFERFCKSCRNFIYRDVEASMGTIYDDCSKDDIHNMCMSYVQKGTTK